jgi:hypothetical protein
MVGRNCHGITIVHSRKLIESGALASERRYSLLAERAEEEGGAVAFRIGRK